MSSSLIPNFESMAVNLGTYTFSSTSSYALPNNIFSNNFNNYYIIINAMQITTAANPYFRLRANGADDTAGNYYYGSYGWSSGGAAINRAGTGGSAIYMTGATTVKADSVYNTYELKMFTPLNPTGRKNYSFQSNYWNSSNVQNTLIGGGFNSTAGAADSLSFNTDGGTMTGYITVYGFRS